MKEEKFEPSDRCASTPDEAWTLRRPTGDGRRMYAAAADFMLENLGQGNGRSLLMVGCPIFAAREMMERGWDLTYLDVRRPPVKFQNFIKSCASQIPCDDEAFDALTSSCVLSHVGMGRYGDPLVEHGDELALAQMARVLKPGAQAAIMFGNVASIPKTVRLGTCHRIYAMQDVRTMLAALPFEVEKTRFWSLATKQWFDDEGKLTGDYLGWPDYVSVLVRKC